jgi:hypothetical protein
MYCFALIFAITSDALIFSMTLQLTDIKTFGKYTSFA